MTRAQRGSVAVAAAACDAAEAAAFPAAAAFLLTAGVLTSAFLAISVISIICRASRINGLNDAQPGHGGHSGSCFQIQKHWLGRHDGQVRPRFRSQGPECARTRETRSCGPTQTDEESS